MLSSAPRAYSIDDHVPLIYGERSGEGDAPSKVHPETVPAECAFPLAFPYRQHDIIIAKSHTVAFEWLDGRLDIDGEVI